MRHRLVRLYLSLSESNWRLICVHHIKFHWANWLKTAQPEVTSALAEAIPRTFTHCATCDFSSLVYERNFEFSCYFHFKMSLIPHPHRRDVAMGRVAKYHQITGQRPVFVMPVERDNRLPREATPHDQLVAMWLEHKVLEMGDTLYPSPDANSHWSWLIIREMDGHFSFIKDMLPSDARECPFNECQNLQCRKNREEKKKHVIISQHPSC